jgi:hypothetical protein
LYFKKIPVALDSHSKGSHSGSSGGSHEPFFSTDFPTLRRNPDSKLALKEISKNAEKTAVTPILDEVPKRSQRQPDSLDTRHSRDSLSMSSAAPKESLGHHHRQNAGNDNNAYHIHQHCMEDHHHCGRPGSGKLFSGNMTPEEMALVLEAAQALVDPPERFSTKIKPGQLVHKHTPFCYAQNDRFVQKAYF